MRRFAAAQNRTVVDLLDDIYREFGFFAEFAPDLKLEGAEGAAKIKRLIDKLRERSTAGTRWIADCDRAAAFWASEDIHDEEGDLVPKENLLFLDLADGRRFAVRPSGTEPKVKYLLLWKPPPAPGASP